MATKYGKKASEKVERTMHEWKRGTLRSGSGGKVTSRKQAIAIGLSQARRAGGKVPSAPRHATMGIDARVRAHLSNMKPGSEIDARGMARALGGVDPLEADYALERAQKAGHAVTSDGRWFGPTGAAHATKKKSSKRSSQIAREIAEVLAKKPRRTSAHATRAARPTPYRIKLTPSELRAVEFARGRYSWPDMLADHSAEDGSIAFTESEMWSWTDDVDADTEGGHSPFPLASDAFAEKLQRFYDTRI